MRLEKFHLICDEIVPNENGCKIWPYALSEKGYPLVGIRWDLPEGGTKGQKFRGNRVVLRRKLGREIRDGYWALHTCDTPACLEMSHIYEGTPVQNQKDVKDRGRQNPARGSDHYRWKLRVAREEKERVANSSK